MFEICNWNWFFFNMNSFCGFICTFIRLFIPYDSFGCKFCVFVFNFIFINYLLDLLRLRVIWLNSFIAQRMSKNVSNKNFVLTGILQKNKNINCLFTIFVTTIATKFISSISQFRRLNKTNFNIFLIFSHH